jgi:penicillin-binding protein 2
LPNVERRILVTIVVFGVLFSLLLFYFWRLQVLDHSLYQRLADNNRIRLIEMPATRGIVTDRNGVILADSTPEYTLAIIPEDMDDDRTAEIASLADLVGRDRKTVIDRFRRNATGAPYSAVRVIDHMSPEEVALFEVSQDRIPGSRLMVAPRRYYPFGRIAAHILGYVGEISGEQIGLDEYPGAKKGDMVGKYALEKAYDKYLRGRDGGRQVEVDARGRELNILGATEPVPGADIELTLDIRLQKALEMELWEERGAGVIMDAQTGEILAMASRPAFDPNEFSLRLTRDRWNEIIADPGHPMQSRAMQGMYPPGSTFKVVTAIAALMEGSIDPDETLTCSGGYRFGRRTYRDWKLGGHGKVDLHRAIVESCDVYFYQTGEKTGIDALARWGLILGLGRRTGIDLPGEKPGLMPSPDWKIRSRDEIWFPGETLSAAIGQGYVLVTPLQLTSLYGTIARKGVHMDPFIVRRIKDPAGNELYRRDPAVKGESEIPEEVFRRVISALAGVVSEDHGTGRVARWAGIPVAGKTGTAQVVRLQEIPEGEDGVPYELRDHGWFVAFAPVKDPKVVCAVVIEHGGHGSTSAAPIVTRLIKKYTELYPVEEPGPVSEEEVQ